MSLPKFGEAVLLATPVYLHLFRRELNSGSRPYQSYSPDHRFRPITEAKQISGRQRNSF